jgi:epoxyqueuosine reductase
MSRTLSSELEARGYRGRVVDIRHLRDLEDEIERQRREKLISEDIYKVLRSAFTFRIPDDMREAHSLIVVALPDPQAEIIFHHGKEAKKLLVPPTYLYYKDANSRAQNLLKEIVEPEEYTFALARVPEKLLAAHSGLAAYGKNNISYVESMGSYHRLVAFYSDYPSSEDSWGEPEVLETCETCPACLASCPTGAITAERFLIRAERCLTFLNEYPGVFPTWVDPSWHHCLVGCLLCQTVCPQNRGLLQTIQAKEEFSEEETDLLLRGIPSKQLPRATLTKLDRLGLHGYLDVLPRNLSQIL